MGQYWANMRTAVATVAKPSHFDHIKEGDGLVAVGEYDEAITAYSHALAMNPTYFITLHRRAKAYRLRGDFEAAMCDINACIHLRPDYSPAFDERAAVYSVEGRTDLAQVDVTRAAKVRALNAEMSSPRVELRPPKTPPKAKTSLSEDVYEEYEKKWGDDRRRHGNVKGFCKGERKVIQTSSLDGAWMYQASCRNNK